MIYEWDGIVVNLRYLVSWEYKEETRFDMSGKPYIVRSVLLYIDDDFKPNTERVVLEFFEGLDDQQEFFELVDYLFEHHYSQFSIYF